MLDVSDGLLLDGRRLARASGVTLALDDPADVFGPDLAVLSAAADTVGVDPVQWVLTGGEDHGLLATFPPGAELPAAFRPVGVVVERSEELVLVAGEPPRAGASGWDHFRA